MSRISRRVFLHATTLASAALGPRPLLAAARDTTTLSVACDLAATESCESLLPLVNEVPLQPLIAQVKRIMAAADYLGTSLPLDRVQELETAFKMSNEGAAAASIQRVLDCHCLAGVEINPEMRVKIAPGA